MRRTTVIVRNVLICASAVSGGAAWAGDKPLYAPSPVWVKPAPATDASTLNDALPILLVYDLQQQLQGDQVWTYLETAKRVASNEALQTLGTITLPWQPDHGDLIVHRVEIIRGTERIDLLKGKQPLTVLRREAQMEQFVLNGQLSATMPVEGLRVGDVLRVAMSVTLRDATLKGHLQTAAPLIREPFRVNFARTRFIWPKSQNIRFKSFAGLPLPATTEAGGFKELLITMPLAKDVDLPKDAPIRFQHLPLVEGNDFSDWSQVSAIMAPLYATDGLIDPKGPIAAEIAKIMRAESDPVKRAAAALQLVQDQIRYQLIALDTGNYVPQTPAMTWSVRYGDCKAKTLVLLAMLRMMGIEAEPVLANLRLGGLVVERLPSAAAFDHIFVRARIAGEDFWLDGTGRGTRLADIRDVPPVDTVLPVRSSGGALVSVARRADARPQISAVIDLDETAGINLPAPFKISVAMRGQLAQQIRLGAAQGSKDDIESFAIKIVRGYLENATIVSHALRFDEAAGTATIDATGIGYPGWNKDDGRLKTVLDTTLSSIEFQPDRARPAWRDIPVSTGSPGVAATVTRIRLPKGGVGFGLEGELAYDDTLAATRIVRKTSLSGDLIIVDTLQASGGAEIPAAAIADERKRIALAAGRRLRALAPADYPNFVAEVADAKRRGKLEPIAAGYAARIATKPDEAERYTDRAWFETRVFDRQKAIDDLTKAAAISPDADTYLNRAKLYLALKDKPKALADITKARELDPASATALSKLALIKADLGDADEALAMVQERIDAGGRTRATSSSSRRKFRPILAMSPARSRPWMRPSPKAPASRGC